mgnify:CR=1 FL=1
MHKITNLATPTANADAATKLYVDSAVGSVAGNVIGNVTGDLTGDVYNSTATKVLESGTTTPTPNGGVSTAYFLGTSSYAIQALTAAYAAVTVEIPACLYFKTRLNLFSS